MLRSLPPRKFAALLGALLLLVIARSAWGAHYPHDWMLENSLTLLFLIGMTVSARKFSLSRVSYLLIFLFMCLHETGAHWTYAEVPYNEWTRALFGTSLNDMLGLERNHFDRLVHFSYGLLLAYPIREILLRVAEVRGFWGYALPLDVAMSTSMIFELIEWGAAEFFGGDLGAAYLGTQGDIWDAHKDMALASLGAAIAMGVTAFINARLQRDFAREFADSLRIKGKLPLGEEEIARMLRNKADVKHPRR